MTLIVDSGFRRGTDVVKALALGADAVMLGRATLYGLAAGGERGVTRALGDSHGGDRSHAGSARVNSVKELGPHLLQATTGSARSEPLT